MQQRQDAQAGLCAIFARRARPRALSSKPASPSRAKRPRQPLTMRGMAPSACNRTGRASFGRQEHDPGAKYQPLFCCRRTEASLKHRALLRPQPDQRPVGYHSIVE